MATINELISKIKEHGHVYLHYIWGHAPYPLTYHLMLSHRGDVCEYYDYNKTCIAIAPITDVKTLSKKIHLCDDDQNKFLGMSITPTL